MVYGRGISVKQVDVDLAKLHVGPLWPDTLKIYLKGSQRFIEVKFTSDSSRVIFENSEFWTMMSILLKEGARHIEVRGTVRELYAVEFEEIGD